MRLAMRLWILALLLLLLPWIQALDDEDLDEDWGLEDEADRESATSGARNVALDLVADLTDASAQRVIGSQEYVLVLGYASWCSRSSALLPQFAAAASDLAGNVAFAKIDAIANPKTANRYGIKGFPTVLFFVNGSVSQAYTGGDSKEEIVNWVRKRTGSPASTVLSKIDAQSFLQNSSVFVVGFFEKFEGHEYESFCEAAKQEIGTQFIQTNDLQVAKAFHSEIQNSPAVWIQKNEPDYYLAFGGVFSSKALLDFIELNKFPIVVKMTSKNAPRINSSPLKLQVLLFAEETDFKTVLPVLQEVAAKYKGKMMFLVVENTDEDIAMPFFSMFGLRPEKPVILAFNYANGQKFLLDEDINFKNLMAFCDGLSSESLPRHYKSESIPVKDDGDLRIVVGKTFETIVLDDSKDVFLQVTSKWCAMCETANKTVEKLATALKAVPSLVVAQIDASENEHPKLDARTYPAFLFYPAGQKNKPIIAHPKTNLKGLVQFVKKHATIPFATPNAETQTRSHDKDEL